MDTHQCPNNLRNSSTVLFSSKNTNAGTGALSRLDIVVLKENLAMTSLSI